MKKLKKIPLASFLALLVYYSYDFYVFVRPYSTGNVTEILCQVKTNKPEILKIFPDSIVPSISIQIPIKDLENLIDGDSIFIDVSSISKCNF